MCLKEGLVYRMWLIVIDYCYYKVKEFDFFVFQ